MPCPDGHRDGGEAPPTAGDVWTASQWDPAMRRDIIEDDPIAAYELNRADELNTVVVILGGALDPDSAQEQLELVTDQANGEIEQIGVLPGREHDLVGGEAHALKAADCGTRGSSENAGKAVRVVSASFASSSLSFDTFALLCRPEQLGRSRLFSFV